MNPLEVATVSQREVRREGAMSKATPGPWHLHDMETAVVCGPDHRALAACDARSRDAEENRANARLIAAAPALADALAALVLDADCDHATEGESSHVCVSRELVERARVALKEAGR